MQSLRTLVLVLIAALFAVSGTARAMPAPAGPPPCHEAPAQHGKSMPAPAAVSCCVGCMPAPTEVPPLLSGQSAEAAVYADALAMRSGRVTAPDPDPPRLRV